MAPTAIMAPAAELKLAIARFSGRMKRPLGGISSGKIRISDFCIMEIQTYMEIGTEYGLEHSNIYIRRTTTSHCRIFPSATSPELPVL